MRGQPLSKQSKLFVGVLAMFILGAAYRLNAATAVLAIGLAPMLGLVMFLGAAESLQSDSWSGRLLSRLPGHEVVLKAHAHSISWGQGVRIAIALAMLGWFFVAVFLAGWPR
jgi:peptidoglycan/LPS O-acetylase OafA/YrhL